MQNIWTRSQRLRNHTRSRSLWFLLGFWQLVECSNGVILSESLVSAETLNVLQTGFSMLHMLLVIAGNEVTRRS